VQIFDNEDFGYHKVTIERPDRRRAAFSAERLAPLRFDKSLREPMEWLWAEYGDKVYAPGFMKGEVKAITAWCEEQGIALNAKARAKLIDTKYWIKLRDLLNTATLLMGDIGTEERRRARLVSRPTSIEGAGLSRLDFSPVWGTPLASKCLAVGMKSIRTFSALHKIHQIAAGNRFREYRQRESTFGLPGTEVGE
jgi:hypothetical protein